jgi:hypothetical protein
VFNPVATIGFAHKLFCVSAIVKTILPMSIMPQAIPLRRGLRVEAVIHVIEDIVSPPYYRVSHGRAVKERWIGKLQFQVQGEHMPLLNQPRGGGHPFRRQQIQRPDLIVIAKYAPGGARRVIRFDG